MSSFNDPRIVRTRQALQDAFLGLMERKPFEEITVRDIATEAGIHYTTLYRHHASKEELLDYIAAEQIRRLVDLTLPAVYSADRHAVHRALCDYVAENRLLWKVLLTGGAAATMRQELLRLCKAAALDRVPRETGIPVELIVLATSSVVVETLAWWLVQPAGEITSEQLASILDQLVFTSLK